MSSLQYLQQQQQQDAMIDDLISGLVHMIHSILPMYNKSITNNTTTNLTHIATSLINISKMNQQDRIIEGLLHVYAELNKNFESFVVQSMNAANDATNNNNNNNPSSNNNNSSSSPNDSSSSSASLLLNNSSSGNNSSSLNLLSGVNNNNNNNNNSSNLINNNNNSNNSSSSNSLLGNNNNSASSNNINNINIASSGAGGNTMSFSLNLSSIHSSSSSSSSNNNNNNNSGSNMISTTTIELSPEELDHRFLRSKLIVFQLFNSLLSDAIHCEKLDLRFDNDFDDEYQMQQLSLHRVSSNGNTTLSDDEQVLFRNLQMIQRSLSNNNNNASNPSTPMTPTAPNTTSMVGTPNSGELALSTASHLSLSSNSLLELMNSEMMGVNSESMMLPRDESKLPKLDPGLASSLVRYIMDTLYPGLDREKDKSQINASKLPPVALRHLAARVLFKVSVLSFDVVFQKVEDFFRGMKTDEVHYGVYNMIEYLNFDNQKLARLFNLVNDASAKFKKSAALAIAQPLRKAIWNYIVNYPHQFISDCKSMTSINGNPNKLFLMFGEKTKKLPQVWPVQAMILLLCPKALSEVIMLLKAGKSDSTYSKEKKFLDGLKTSSKLKNEKADAAIACFIDLYKASSYLSKDNYTALRFLMSEVQGVVMDRLDTPMKNSESKPDLSMMVDFLVSSYRVNYRNAVSCIFPHFIKGSSFCKLAMARTLLTLSKEQAPLPWHPTLSDSYSHVSKAARSMCQDALQEERHAYQQRLNSQKDAPSTSSGLSVKRITGSKPKEQVEVSYAGDILLSLLATFYQEPLFPLQNTAENDKTHSTDILYFFLGLTNCMGEKNAPQVQYHAQRLLQRLFHAKYIGQWVPGDVISGFIDISSNVIIQLTSILLEDKDMQGEHIIPILDLVREIINRVNQFISQNKDLISDEHLASRKRSHAWENLENILLVFLCSPDPLVWTLAASFLGDLCHQVEILDMREEAKSNAFILNYRLYKEIAAVVENGEKRERQLKSILRLLRRDVVQSKANVTAFIEVYHRWKNYTAKLSSLETKARENRQDTDFNISTRMKTMWYNYTTFLCSMGGVGLQIGDGIAFSKGVNHKIMAEDLVKELLKLLTKEPKYISDNVTRIVGSDLSPAVYRVLLASVTSDLASSFGEDNSVKVTPTSTLFVDKAINIVKNIVEQADGASEYLAVTNFDTLLLSFIRYCSQLVSPDSTAIKCNLCLLIVAAMNKRNYLSFGNEVQFKFNALKSIAEWTSEFASNLRDDSQSGSSTSRRGTIDTGLDEVCLKAISTLLKHLPLAKIRREKMTTAEKNEMNRREFIKYFHFLSKYLTKYSNSTKSQLREFTIVSLGNLLESNINYGLEQFMKMTYAEDQETRSAFLAVLTKIVKQGIQLEQTELVEPTEKYEKLLNSLCSDDMSLIFLILKAVSMSEQDELCKVFVKLFADRCQILPLLRTAIDLEVMQTPRASTLFRANSFASKMLSSFCALYAKDYMFNILTPLLTDVCSDTNSYEIDPNRLAGGDLQENIRRLTKVTQRFIDAILDSTEECPLTVRIVCEHLARTVGDKFPTEDQDDSVEATDIGQTPKYVAMGGMLVLRFLNPSIASPTTAGIISPQPNAKTSRNLLLISKLLQNVANGVKFKEDFMQCMNPFITTNFPRMRSFFESLAEVYLDDEAYPGEVILLDDDVKAENVYNLHKALYNNIDKIRQNAGSEQLKDQLEKVGSVLIELGKPAEKEKLPSSYTPSSGGAFTNTHFENFMTLMGSKPINLDYIEEKSFFYKRGVSKDQRPVLYFVPRNCEGIETDEDMENALYHVLKTLQTVFTKPYEIVIDSTDFSEENGLQITQVSKLLKLLPDGAKENIARFVVFAPNLYFKDFVRPIQNKIISRKNIKKIHFASNVKELQSVIDDKNIALPEDSTHFDDDVQLTISPAWVVSSANSSKEATIKLGSKKLCVIVQDDAVMGMPTKRVEYFAIPNINVRLERSSENDSTEHVVIDYESVPPRQLIIKTEMNKQLQMGIKASKVRLLSELHMAASYGESDDSRGTMTQEDVPGSVLNMCFLNLESKFPQTRREAYNLLAALAEQFSFPVKLLESNNVCVPHNTGDLVVTLSEKVAGAKPSLTSQFLTESLRGFNKVSLAYKLLCLKYMKPWIPNLASEYARAQESNDTTVINKIREWFPELVKSTMEFPDVYPAMLSELWGEISKEESLVEISMECILSSEVSLESATTEKREILNDLVVTLSSSQCSDLVVNTILNSAMTTLNEEVVDAEEPIENNNAWIKLIRCSRFLLMLSFQNRIDVVNNVPSIFYVISLMVGRGSYFVRSTVHSLTLNVIHSLATALEFTRDQMKLIEAHLAELNSPKFKNMFLGNTVDSTNPFVGHKSISKDKPYTPTMNDIQTLGNYMLDVMKTCSLVNGFIQRDWESQYNELYKPSSSLNQVILPRVITIYGVISKSARDHEQDLPFLFDCLLDSFNGQRSKADLSTAILLYFTQYCNKISTNDAMLSKLILIPLMLLPYCDIILYPTVLNLLETGLVSVSQSHQFNEGASFDEYFNQYVREPSLESYIQRFEKIIGISLKTHFSFALSSFLIKGLTHAQTKERTLKFLESVLGISCQISNIKMYNKREDSMSEILGFATLLASFDFDSTIASIGIDKKQFFSEETFCHDLSGLLFTRLLLLLVQNMESEVEKIAVYKLLQHVYKKIPFVFEGYQSDITPRVIQQYTLASRTSNYTALPETILGLVNTIMSVGGLEKSVPVSTNSDVLKDILFLGVTRLGSFRGLNEQTAVECCAVMSDFVRATFPNGAGKTEIVKGKIYRRPRQSRIGNQPNIQLQSQCEYYDD